ncbi:ABC transporter substrate-binding protein [Sphingomonas gei]|uniref:ABC transporter substrate-binding protein n=1 Tax=Sphingomonas gei TaxID=1395960 RepID=A0A4S1X2L7_9SPHN|nr:ABC transporter substrate-binding protein [Sphingomonas gei]TGX50184.1 ABC transporter substrate-binding protein [Sphingomonas gei]
MRGAALLCLLAAGCAAQPSAKGGGIVSLNPCADAMLVELVPPARIAAISHYSRDPGASSIAPDVAARYRTNNGTAEEIIALRPDLAIIDSFASVSTREALARAGVKTLTLGWASTIEDSKKQVRELAAALNARPAGDAMVARIDGAIAAARTDRPPLSALLWIGGNTVNGSGTLLDEMMVKAGFSDHAAHYGLQGTGYLPIEHVVADPPRVMLVPDEAGRDAGSRAAQMRGWALARSGAKVDQARFNRSLVNCGGPVIARAMTRLAEVRREVGE